MDVLTKRSGAWLVLALLLCGSITGKAPAQVPGRGVYGGRPGRWPATPEAVPLPDSYAAADRPALPPQYFAPPPVHSAPFAPAVQASFQPETEPSASSLKEMEERLAKLEGAWKEQEESEAAAKAAAAKKPTMNITGRIHLDSWSFTEDDEGIGFFENPDTGADPENRLFFRRLRIGWQGTAFETMLYKMEFDFNEPSNPEIKDNYIGFQHLPVFQRVLIGNQKRPLGLDHWNSSRYNIFIERPLVVEAFNEDTRRLGICSYNVSDDEVYNWQYGAYLLENPAESGSVIGDSRQGSFNARLASSPWYDEPSDGRYYLHWAIAGMVARPDGDVFPTDTNPNLGRFRTRSEIRSDSRWLDTGPIAGAENYEILGLESIYNYGPLQIVAEYQNTWLQRDETTPGTGPDVMFHGGYIYLAYFLTGEHMTYERDTGQLGRPSPFENFFVVRDADGRICHGWGAWQVAIRYSYLDISDEDIFGGIGSNTTLALVWYFNPYSSLQLNAVYGEIEEHEPAGGFTEGEFVALGARLRIDF
jgi:phosphate-selective porin OprO/OprP